MPGVLGGATERLEFLLDFNGERAITGARRFGDTMEHELGRADKATDNTGRKLQTFGAGAAVFAGVAIKGLADFAHEAEHSEEVNIRLENSVHNNAGTAGDSVKPFHDLAKAIEHKTAADDEDIAAGESVLIQRGRTKQQVEELTPLIVDLARKQNVDEATASRAVSMAIEGKGKALGKMNVVLDQAAYASDHYSAVVQGLRGSVGGFAEQEGATFSGRMERLANISRDLEEKVGVGVVHAFEHFGDVAENVIGFVDKLNPGIAAGVGEWGTYGIAVIGAAGALSFTIGTVERGIDRFSTLADWLHIKRAATVEDTVATEANAAANLSASAAADEYALANYDWAASEADVIAAEQARAAASMEMALADGEAAAAAAGLIAAEEGVAAAATEAATAEGAADVAALGLGGGLAVGVAAAAVGVGVFSALNDALSSNVQGQDDYTKALQDSTRAIDDNVAKVTAKKLADNDSTRAADAAGVSFELQARAIKSGTDNFGEYSRILDGLNRHQAGMPDNFKEIAQRLRDAGAGSTEFGQALIAQVESGKLSTSQIRQLVEQIEGLHNGYVGATKSAQDKANADSTLKSTEEELGASTDDTTGSLKAQQDALDKLKKAEDEARGAQDSLIGSEVSLAKAHQSTEDSVAKLQDAQDKLNKAHGSDAVAAQHDYDAAMLDTISSIDSEAQSAARAAETQAKARGETFSATDAQKAYIDKLWETASTTDPDSPLGQHLRMYIAQLEQTQGTFVANIQANTTGADQAIADLISRANSIGGVAQIAVVPGRRIQQATGDLIDLPENVPVGVGEQGREDITRVGNRIAVTSSGAVRGPQPAGGVTIGVLNVNGASAADVVDELDWRLRMRKY